MICYFTCLRTSFELEAEAIVMFKKYRGNAVYIVRERARHPNDLF